MSNRQELIDRFCDETGLSVSYAEIVVDAGWLPQFTVADVTRATREHPDTASWMDSSRRSLCDALLQAGIINRENETTLDDLLANLMSEAGSIDPDAGLMERLCERIKRYKINEKF